MANITGFSPAVQDALRQFSIEQLREINERSPLVTVNGGRCSRCGFVVELTYDTPADALRAVKMTHELSWEIGRRCGGQVEFLLSAFKEPAQEA